MLAQDGFLGSSVSEGLPFGLCRGVRSDLFLKEHHAHFVLSCKIFLFSLGLSCPVVILCPISLLLFFPTLFYDFWQMLNMSKG